MPECKCHREPMLWNRKNDRSSGGTWRCATKHRERNRRWFEDLSGPTYSLRLLKARRRKALARRKRRRETNG